MASLPHPDPAKIEQAAQIVDPVFLNTDVVLNEALNKSLGCNLVAKDETSTPIGSFKGRGADFWIQTANPDRRPVICASAGNFGQGVAFSATKRNIPVTIYAAKSANPRKIAAMSELGADVRLAGQDFDAAKDAARSYARSIGADYLEDGAHPAIAEGAGTIAYELTQSGFAFEAILVPVGNGALIGGIGTWLKHCSPQTRVVGVTAERAAAMACSWQQKRVVETDTADTLADGIAVRKPISYAVEVMADTVDDIISVSDTVILDALKRVYDHCGIVLEPAGAVGIAAILENRDRFADRTIATIFCGGNISQNVAQQVGIPIN